MPRRDEPVDAGATNSKERTGKPAPGTGKTRYRLPIRRPGSWRPWDRVRLMLAWSGVRSRVILPRGRFGRRPPRRPFASPGGGQDPFDASNGNPGVARALSCPVCARLAILLRLFHRAPIGNHERSEESICRSNDPRRTRHAGAGDKQQKRREDDHDSRAQEQGLRHSWNMAACGQACQPWSRRINFKLPHCRHLESLGRDDFVAQLAWSRLLG